MSSYPVFLQVKHFKCLVVGGGAVATRKVEGLLAVGALPVVIAPWITEELKAFVKGNQLEWQPRVFMKGDTSDFQLIIAATNNAEINRAIRVEATFANLMVNDVSDPEGSNFHAPAIVRREPLELAIGTSGTVPYLSRKIRMFLEDKFTPEIGHKITEIQKRRAAIITKAAGDEDLKKQLQKQELDPLVEQFLRHFLCTNE